MLEEELEWFEIKCSDGGKSDAMKLVRGAEDTSIDDGAPARAMTKLVN